MGGLEVIEERDPSEVTDRRLPEGVTVRNPVFDVTPASYVDLVVTEVGAVPPTYVISLMRERLGWAMDPGAEK
jgi:ribose 1,5-bisphosphate isomerase